MLANFVFVTKFTTRNVARIHRSKVAIRPGQWVRAIDGQPARYVGTTASGRHVLMTGNLSDFKEFAAMRRQFLAENPTAIVSRRRKG